MCATSRKRHPIGARCCAALAALALAGCGGESLDGVRDLAGEPVDPFAGAKATVTLFVDSDCPVSNRFAPEMRRLYEKYAPRGVDFWLVYPDPRISPQTIREHMRTYDYPMRALRDPEHTLVALAKARVTPEAGVFVPDRRLVYHGRIDDRYVDIGRQRAQPTRHDVDEVLAAVLAGGQPETNFSPGAGRPVAFASQPGVGCFIRDFR